MGPRVWTGRRGAIGGLVAGIAMAATMVAGPAFGAAAPAMPQGMTAPRSGLAPGQSADIGYAATGAAYTSVTATWRVPALTCAGTGESDLQLYAGIDGDGDASIEQVGTDVECYDGTVTAYGFTDVYPAYPVTFPNQLRTGDTVTATVTVTAAKTFTFELADATQGWSATRTAADTTAQLASAEVMATDDGATFGEVDVTKALINGKPLADADPVAFGDNQVSLIGPDGESFTIYDTPLCTLVCPGTNVRRG